MPGNAVNSHKGVPQMARWRLQVVNGRGETFNTEHTYDDLDMAVQIRDQINKKADEHGIPSRVYVVPTLQS